MIRNIRILLWKIVSDWEQRLYPYEKEDNNDYYYTIKNEETGESYMKSFDERIIRLQDEMRYVQIQLKRINVND